MIHWNAVLQVAGGLRLGGLLVFILPPAHAGGASCRVCRGRHKPMRHLSLVLALVGRYHHE